MIPEGLIMHAEREAPANPFPGLRPFEFDESHLYFGRDGQSDQLIRKLSATRFVAVVGTSGSGKSSLARAGLLPDLFSGYMAAAGSNWRVGVIRPGNDPLGNLARALNDPAVFGSEIEENARIQTAITEATLRRGSLGLVESVRHNRMPSNENLLVLVDQFEELFRFARVSGSEQYRYEAAAFVKLLLEASRQREHAIYVVLTMRSDFLGDCSIFWDLPEAINEGQYLVPRMTRDQRAEAVTGPIAVYGGHITQRLVNRLLNDTGDNPDLLPILQHAMMRTWERWKEDHAAGEAVDLRHYEAIGGMAEALSRHADEAYHELPDERSRKIAEAVFKALTEKGEDNREVRRPTELKRLSELSGATPQEVAAVVEVFRREGRSFLMPPASVPLGDDSLIDISHESLIRNWGRLKAWVDEESLSAQIYTRLAETAVLHDRGRAGLWRDPDLQHALDWREQTGPTAAWAERYHPAFDSAIKFLDASVAARDAAVLEAKRRQQREVRRARVTATVFFLLFMLSLLASAFAYNKSVQAQEALDEARKANEQAQTERARAVAERDRAGEQSEIARRNEQKAKDAESVALEKQKESEESKAEALKQAEIAGRNERQAEVAKLEADKQRANAVAETTKNRQLLYASDMNLAQQAYDTANIRRGRELLAAHSLASGDAPGFEWYYLWRALNSETDTFALGDAIRNIALSRDGSTLAIARSDAIELWDADSRQMRSSMEMRPSIGAFALSPDGQRFAFNETAKADVKLVDAASPRKAVTLKGQPAASVTSLAFSPDGQTLAIGNENHRVELWDPATREKRAGFGHTSLVISIAFSPDSGTVAAGGIDGAVRLWDVKADKQLCSLSGYDRFASFLTFSPDGKNLFTGGGFDGAVKLWEVALCKEQFKFKGAGGSVTSLALSPDGQTLFASYDDITMKVWDIRSRRELATFKGHQNYITSSTFSPGGRMLLTGSYDGTVKRWDIASHVREQSPLRGHNSLANTVAFSPDGKKIATGSYDDTVRLWDAETHQALGPPYLSADKSVYSVTFSPDGRTLAVGGESPLLKLLDADTFKELASFQGQSGKVFSVAFSPDGKRLVTGGDDDTVKLWDVASASLVKGLKFERNVVRVAFSPDGRLIAAVIGDGLTKVWDNTLSKEIVSLQDGGGRNSFVGLLTRQPYACRRDGERFCEAAVRRHGQRACHTLRPQGQNLRPRLLARRQDARHRWLRRDREDVARRHVQGANHDQSADGNHHVSCFLA